jgi:L-amino acid N-acyltransferase YncA
MSISPATLEDARAIAQVHVLSWQHAYRDLLPQEFLASLSVAKREAMWREIITLGTSELLVAKAAGQVCGFANFGVSRDEGAAPHTAELMAIYLLPQVWSTGVGRVLLHDTLDRTNALGFERITLRVIANNTRAIRFYEAAGFTSEPSSLKHCTVGGVSLEEIRYGRPIARH